MSLTAVARADEQVAELNDENDLLLHWAALNDGLEMVEFLYNKGCDVNLVNEKGESALHWCAAKGHLRMSILLMRLGADVTCRDRKGWTAMHRAAMEVGVGVL